MLLQEQFDLAGSAIQLAGFIALFLAAGAIGFRYTVLHHRLVRPPSSMTEERRMYGQAAVRAAIIGIVGMVISIGLMFSSSLPQQAARQHMAVGQLITHTDTVMVQVALAIVALAGFALAAGSISAGWLLAAVGVVAGTLSAAFFGNWLRLINPMHELFAGFWIGTLFVLVVGGLASVSRSRLTSAERGRAVADMVNAFSPLALISFAVLGIFGVITAWRHLGTLSALWTTPYGESLIWKLLFVAVVVGLGAFNWKRQTPLLGTEQAGGVLRKSATAELVVALIVLLITARLVTLPAPSESKPQPKAGASTGTAE